MVRLETVHFLDQRGNFRGCKPTDKFAEGLVSDQGRFGGAFGGPEEPGDQSALFLLLALAVKLLAPGENSLAGLRERSPQQLGRHLFVRKPIKINYIR